MNTRLIVQVLQNLHKRVRENESLNPEFTEMIRHKDAILARFQKVFDEDALDNLLDSDFYDFLDFKQNKHWTNLRRSAPNVRDDKPRLIRFLRHLFDENLPIEERIKRLTEDPDHSIHGLKKAIMTPLLLVRYPDKYGVWNGKTESAMKTLGIWPEFPHGTSMGEKYRRLNDIFLNLSEVSGYDLWTLDGLWHVANELCLSDLMNDFVEEEEERKVYYEGQKKLISGYTYERSVEAREGCLKHYDGYDCYICGFNFFDFYGEIGLAYIHVHHREDIALDGSTHEVDPKRDLVPVCPNCHAMLHRGVKRARKVEQLKRIVDEIRAVKGK